MARFAESSASNRPENEGSYAMPSQDGVASVDLEQLVLTSEDAVNRFGGQWTLDKLEMVRQYLSGYTTALKNQRFRLMYIDAFAGTGKFEDSSGETHDGSATIALETVPGFERLIFVEKHKTRCDALRVLADQHPDRQIDIIRGDANQELQKICGSFNRTQYRAVLFLDPFGLDVHWATLEAIRRTEAIDVWYLCSFSGLYRQMARDSRKVDADKDAAITRFFGTDAWRDELYEKVPTGDLFGDDRRQRLSLDAVREFVTRRLKSLFPAVLAPKTIYYAAPNGKRGAPAFDLYFAVSNPSPKAIAPARRIAGHILKAL